MMEKLKNSPFLIMVLSILFTLILGSYAFTWSASSKSVAKDSFALFLTEYRSNTNMMFQLIKELKK